MNKSASFEHGLKLHKEHGAVDWQVTQEVAAFIGDTLRLHCADAVFAAQVGSFNPRTRVGKKAFTRIEARVNRNGGITNPAIRTGWDVVDGLERIVRAKMLSAQDVRDAPGTEEKLSKQIKRIENTVIIDDATMELAIPELGIIAESGVLSEEEKVHALGVVDNYASLMDDLNAQTTVQN